MTVYPTFNLDGKDAAEVTAEFRFEKKDIPALYEALRIPEIFKCQHAGVSLRWNDGFVHRFKEANLSMSLQRYDPYLWCFCPGIVHDLQHCNQLYFQ